MKAKGLSRKRLAAEMGTSRSQISRLLDPSDGKRHTSDVAAGRRIAWAQGQIRTGVMDRFALICLSVAKRTADLADGRIRP